MPIPNLDMSINNDKDIKDLVGYDGICTQQYDMGLSQSGGLALNLWLWFWWKRKNLPVGGLKKLLGMDPWHIGFGILEALAVAVFQIPPRDFLVYVSSWNDLMLYPNWEVVE